MNTMTSTTLLEGLADPANREAWERYVDRYRPLLVRFAGRLGIGPSDAEDVAQATLLEFSISYRDGAYDRDRGRLRSWLFGIARNQVRAFVRRRPREVAAGDVGDTSGVLAAVPESRDELEELWDREWRDAVLRQCLDEVRREVQSATFEAFRLFALEGRPAADVAAELDITENAVFLAKRRVLRRARELVPVMEDVW